MKTLKDISAKHIVVGLPVTYSLDHIKLNAKVIFVKDLDNGHRAVVVDYEGNGYKPSSFLSQSGDARYFTVDESRLK